MDVNLLIVTFGVGMIAGAWAMKLIACRDIRKWMQKEVAKLNEIYNSA